MGQTLKSKHYDVVVVGGGSAGVAAAISAKKLGANVLLIEAGPALGGELVSGLPIDGCLNSRGEWIVGGVARELFNDLDAAGGYIGPVFDWRLIWGVCLDPEMFKLVIVETISKYQIPVLLYTFSEDVVVDNSGRVQGIIVVNKNGRTLITADVFVDCTGDGDVAMMAGADFLHGGDNGEFQPVTLVFRMTNVDYKGYITHVRDHPEEFILGESPVIDMTAEQCAKEIYNSGHPFAGISASGPLLGRAIQSGEMFPCTAVYVWPTSVQRREVGLNTTRIANLDATDTENLSKALSTLTTQVNMAMRFLQTKVPGFESSYLSGVAPRIGIRETRRILGEEVLETEAVIAGEKREDGIAKGGHHVDIHGAGTSQKRIPVEEGKSYDIPYGTLIPRKLRNVLVAGRCISSTREANGSVRVMGQCMATGEAAGAAAAIAVRNDLADVRDVAISELRHTLRDQGAVLDGTH
jgi:hypothetical protein